MVSWRNGLLKTSHALVQLSAHTTDKKIAEGRHSAKQNRRTIIELLAGLGQTGQRDATFGHGRAPAMVYSGWLSLWAFAK